MNSSNDASTNNENSSNSDISNPFSNSSENSDSTSDLHLLGENVLEYDQEITNDTDTETKSSSPETETKSSSPEIDVDMTKYYNRQNGSNLFFKHISNLILKNDVKIWFDNVSLSQLSSTDIDNEELSIMRTTQITIIMDEISSIFSHIPIEVKEKPNIKTFISSINDDFSNIVNYIMDFDYWNFVPIELFLWITLSFACKSEPEIIKHILLHPKFNKNILTRKGYCNMTLLHFACLYDVNEESLITLLELDGLTKDDLLERDVYGYNCIMYASIYSEKCFTYILNNDLVSYEQLWTYIPNTSIDIVNIMCELESNNISHILDSKYMNNDIYKKLYYNNATFLMLSSKLNNNIFKKVIDSEYVTNADIDFSDTFNRTVFHYACRFNPYNAIELLNRNKITKDTLEKYVIENKYNNVKINSLYMSVENIDLFKAILEYKEFTSTLLCSLYKNKNIIHYTIQRHIFLKEVIKSQYFKMNIVITSIYNYFIALCGNNSSNEIVETILNHPDFNQEYFNKKNSGFNAILKACTINNNIDNIKLLLKSKYINEDNLLVKLRGKNSLTYIISKYPELLDDIINMNILTEKGYNTYIKKGNDEIALYNYMLINTQSEEQFKKLLDEPNAKYFLLNKDSNCTSILQTLLQLKKLDYIKIIMNSNSVTKELLSSTDKNNCNILMYCLNILIEEFDDNIYDIYKLIFNNKYCDDDIVAHANDNNNTLLGMSLQDTKTLKIAEDILNSDKYNCNNENYCSILLNCIEHDCIDGIKLLLSSRTVMSIYITYKNIDLNSALHLAAKKSLEILKYMQGLDVYNNNMLSMKNKNKCNIFMYACIYNNENAHYLLDNNYVTKEIVNDILKVDNEICASIINSDNILQKIVDKKVYEKEFIINLFNKIIQNIEHINDNSLKIILVNNYFNKFLLTNKYYTLCTEETNIVDYNIHKIIRANKKKSVLAAISLFDTDELLILQHTVYGNIINISHLIDGLLDILMEKEYMTEEIFWNTDSKGYNCLHSSCEKGNIRNIKSILNSKFCDNSDLVRLTDDNMNSLSLAMLYNKIDVIKTLLHSSKCSYNMIIDVTDTNDRSLCMYLYDNKQYDLVDEIVNGKFCTEQLFTDLDHNNNNILVYSLKDTTGKSTMKLLENKYCTEKSINQLCGRDKLPFLYYAIGYPNIFNYILDSDKDLTDTFKLVEKSSYVKNIQNIYIQTGLSNEKLFEKLLDSKYFKPEHLLKTNKYGNSVLIEIISNKKSLGVLTSNKKIWNVIKEHRDKNNTSFIAICSYNDIIFSEIINNKLIDIDILDMKDNFDVNVLHYCVKNDRYNAVKCIIESAIFDEKLLKNKDKRNNTIFHSAIYGKNNRIIDLLFPYINQETLKIKNIFGNTILHESIINTLDIVIKIIDSELCDYSILSDTDNHNNTYLMLSHIYFPSLVKNIINNKCFDKKLILERNSKYLNSLQHACIYAASVLPLYLDICEEKDAMNWHSEYGSALILASRYQPKAVKYLLDWNKTTDKLLSCLYNKQNFLQIACRYNADSVKYAVSSDWDLNDMLTTCEYVCHSEIHQLPLILACQYNAEAVKYILNSKYASTDLLKQKSFQNKISIHYALDCQPNALLYILNSKYCNKKLISTPYNSGYKVVDLIKMGNPSISDLNNIEEKIPLFKCKNILSTNDTDSCNICYSFKAVICLIPCIHTLCVSCAIKSKKCPFCKSYIKQKKKIF